MSEIRFHFEEMHREVDDFYNLAKPFLDPSAEDCLGAFAAKLMAIRSKAPLANNPQDVLAKRYGWVIPEHQPLLTKPSRRYEKGQRQGGLEIVGRLTAVWEITPDAKRNSLDTPKQFRLSGNASIVVEWVNAANHECVASWNVDVAAPPAAGESPPPGCMFHVQLPNASRVPVPRLPCLAFTPLAVAEFVLSELFQSEWESHTLTAASENWSSVQKRRMSRLLAWQQALVEAATGPPWTVLKRERIPHDRFLATS